MSGIESIAMEFCGRGGKRLRPRLCKAAFAAAGGDAADSRIGALCDAVECFHKASLVHDDIQDGDEERYGRPTVWKEHGVAIAIAAGDWLVAHGYRLIAESGFDGALEMMKATVKSHVALCDGQGDDLLGTAAVKSGAPNVADEEYVSVCERKTGEAFALAAELGALAAGADGAPFRRYGLDFGVLFQVRDDLADGEAPEGADVLADGLAEKLESSAVARALGKWYVAGGEDAR